MKGKIYFLDGTNINLINDNSIEENIEIWQENGRDSKKNGNLIKVKYDDSIMILNIDSVKYILFKDYTDK